MNNNFGRSLIILKHNDTKLFFLYVPWPFFCILQHNIFLNKFRTVMPYSLTSNKEEHTFFQF
ncbi:hypothetical protein PGB90_005079 [Kerria lacca]